MSTPTFLRSFIALSVALLAAPAPVRAQQPATPQQPVRIGVSISITGQYAEWAAPARAGYQLCQRHLNDQGGLLGREVQLILYDDGSEWQKAIILYEKLIIDDKVDGLMGPFSSLTTDAVATITEKHRKVMMAPLAATTSIWEKGRKYVFMVRSPSEVYLEGLIDLATRNGLKTLALIHEDNLFGRAVVKGAIELAKKKGMEVSYQEPYPKGDTDLSAMLNKIKEANPDVLAVATSKFWDLIKIMNQMRSLEVDVKMLGSSVGNDLSFGRTGDYAYGVSQWETGLQYAGVKEFVEAYKKEFNSEPTHVSAAAYGACQLFAEAVRRAGSVDSEKVREELVKLRTKTVFGDYAVDERGFQVGHKMVTYQWSDGKPVPVWPDELAIAKPRFPTPPWKQR